MAPRLTPARRSLLEEAVRHPQGRISGRSSASDQRALEDLGYAASVDEHGHVLVDGERLPYGHPHQGCPHFLSITSAGREALR